LVKTARQQKKLQDKQESLLRKEIKKVEALEVEMKKLNN
jgi:hypothetical protein